MALSLAALLAASLGQFGDTAPDRPVPVALGQAEILQVLDSHKLELAGCNEKFAGDAVTNFVVHFKILPDGSTAGVKSKGGKHLNQKLAACVERIIRHATFGSYSGKPMPPVDFPLSFGPVEGRAPKSRPPTKRDLKEALAAHKADFDRCRADHPGASGTVTFHWVVDPDGTPDEVRHSGGDAENPSLVECLEHQISALRFRPYDAPRPVEFDRPFNL